MRRSSTGVCTASSTRSSEGLAPPASRRNHGRSFSPVTDCRTLACGLIGQRYPAASCAMLEEVWLGWCPHLLEVEAFLLKIRKAGIDGQVRPERRRCYTQLLFMHGRSTKALIDPGIYLSLCTKVGWSSSVFRIHYMGGGRLFSVLVTATRLALLFPAEGSMQNSLRLPRYCISTSVASKRVTLWRLYLCTSLYPCSFLCARSDCGRSFALSCSTWRFLLPSVQEDEACALRCLDVSGNEGLSDGILKVSRPLGGNRLENKKSES